jgi:hypothetical protein
MNNPRRRPREKRASGRNLRVGSLVRRDRASQLPLNEL